MELLDGGTYDVHVVYARCSEEIRYWSKNLTSQTRRQIMMDRERPLFLIGHQTIFKDAYQRIRKSFSL